MDIEARCASLICCSGKDGEEGRRGAARIQTIRPTFGTGYFTFRSSEVWKNFCCKAAIALVSPGAIVSISADQQVPCFDHS